jgi:hypothetical protein
LDEIGLRLNWNIHMQISRKHVTTHPGPNLNSKKKKSPILL